VYWTRSGGTGRSLTTWPGSNNGATFAGSDGTWTITISGTQYCDSIYVSNNGYTFTGGTAINFGSKKGIYIASGKSATFGTPIAGSGGICLTGGGTLITGAAHTYTGATTITSGTLQLSTTNERVPDASAIVLANDATAIFNVNGLTETVGSIAGGGGSGGNITLGAGYLTVGGNNTSTMYGGVISGSLTGTTAVLTKAGSGTLHLTNANTYTAPTQINGGILAVDYIANANQNSGIGASQGTASYLYINGGILAYAGTTNASTDRLMKFGATGGGIYSNGTGTINFTSTGNTTNDNGTKTIEFGGTYAGGINTFAPALYNPTSGSMSVLKSGNCTWQLSSTNSTFSGGIRFRRYAPDYRIYCGGLRGDHQLQWNARRHRHGFGYSWRLRHNQRRSQWRRYLYHW
jgi:fibronectin-binding autotransporter adhesin